MKKSDRPNEERSKTAMDEYLIMLFVVINIPVINFLIDYDALAQANKNYLMQNMIELRVSTHGQTTIQET